MERSDGGGASKWTIRVGFGGANQEAGLRVLTLRGVRIAQQPILDVPLGSVVTCACYGCVFVVMCEDPEMRSLIVISVLLSTFATGCSGADETRAHEGFVSFGQLEAPDSCRGDASRRSVTERHDCGSSWWRARVS